MLRLIKGQFNDAKIVNKYYYYETQNKLMVYSITIMFFIKYSDVIIMKTENI